MRAGWWAASSSITDLAVGAAAEHLPAPVVGVQNLLRQEDAAEADGEAASKSAPVEAAAAEEHAKMQAEQQAKAAEQSNKQRKVMHEQERTAEMIKLSHQ